MNSAEVQEMIDLASRFVDRGAQICAMAGSQSGGSRAAMLSMWMFRGGAHLRRTLVLKPSERDPSPGIRIAELLTQPACGWPTGSAGAKYVMPTMR